MIKFIKKIFNLFLPNTEFVKGVSTLAGGTASEQILMLVAIPILTRLYTPENFGLFAVYINLLALIGVISSLRYQLAIPLPKDDVEAANITVLSLLILLLTTFFTGTLIFMLGSYISELINMPLLADFLWLLPISIFLSGVFVVLSYWLVRIKNFNVVASTKFIQTSVMLIIQLIIFKLGAQGLLGGLIAGQSTGAIRFARLTLVMSVFKQVSLHGILNVAKRYRQFPVFSTWGAFTDAACTKLPTIVLFAVFGSTIAGLFSIAERVMQIPITLISGSINQVVLSNTPEINRQGKLKFFVEKVNSKLIHIGMPPALLIFISAPELFSIIFGENWRQAGEFAKWMTPWSYFLFLSTSLHTIFAVTEKIYQLSIWQFFLFVINLAAISVGIFFGDAMKTIIFLSIGNTVCHTILLVMIGKVTNIPIFIFFKPMISAFIISLVCSLPLLLVSFFYENRQGILIVTFFISLLLILGRYYILARNRNE